MHKMKSASDSENCGFKQKDIPTGLTKGRENNSGRKRAGVEELRVCYILSQIAPPPPTSKKMMMASLKKSIFYMDKLVTNMPNSRSMKKNLHFLLELKEM